MSSDRNLLFGILAVQMDFISRDALIQAMHAWLLNKQTSLGDILQQQKSLTSERAQLLEALVQEHLKSHGNDPQKSLAALSSVESMKDALLHLPDTQLQQSLLALAEHTTPYQQGMKAESHGYDPSSGATRSYIAADSSSRFRILRPHAKGGLGEVFVAEDTELHREVALKEIQDKHSHNENSRGRFILEAEVTGGLEHPNIVPVYGLGTYADGRPYYAMRFIRGDSLKEAIERFYKTTFPNASERNLAFRSLLKRFIDVCNAIAYAHSRGILHRDLKPGNIMLGKYGETLVVDWGLAKAMGKSNRAGEGTDEYEERTLNPSGSSYAETMAGSAIGTPAFMSPEQAAGRLDQLGPPSDVYSLGATLYVILTGELPFTEKGYEILKKVEDGNFPPPRQDRPEIPNVLNAIVLKAMAKSIDHRYHTATALAEEIEHYLADEPVTAYQEPVLERTKRWARKHPGMVAGLTATLLVGVMGLVIGSIMLSGKNEALASMNSSLARANGSLDVAVKDANEKEALAIRRAKELQHEVERFQVGIGFPLMGNGDFWGGMLWFAQPLMAQEPSDAEELYLERIASYWRWSKHHSLMHHTVINASVKEASFSLDGSRLVTVSSDMITQVWDAFSGRPLTPPLPHKRGVRHANFNPNGLQIVTVSGDDTARVWEVSTGKLVQSLSHRKNVNCAKFSPDGRYLVTTSDDKTARMWDAVSGKPTTSSLQHNGPVYNAFFSPDSRLLVTTCGDRTAQVWDTATGLAVTQSLSHKDYVINVCFSPDSRRIVTASFDGSVQVWDVATGASILPLMAHRSAVTSAIFSPDGRRVVTASLDSTARVWDASTGQPITSLLTHNAPVHTASFSSDGRRVVTASDDKSARVWDASTGQQLALSLTHQGKVIHAYFGSDDRRIVTFSSDGTLRMWDIATDLPLPLTLTHALGLTYAGFSHDSRRVATASMDKTARVWNANTGQALTPPLKHDAFISHISFSPDGRYVLTASADKTAKVWDTVTGHPMPFTLQHNAQVNRGEYSPDGRLILTVSLDTVRLWDAAKGRMLPHQLTHNGAQIIHASFSPQGSHMVTTSSDSTAIIWDVTTGQRAFTPLKHSSIVNNACFSPDGSRVVTVSVDMTARVWNASTGEAITPFMNHLGNVNYASFSHDGQRLVTASDDKTARVWDALTGQPLAPPMYHQGPVFHASFSEDGRRVVTASTAMMVQKWDATTAQPITPAMSVSGGVTHDGISMDGQRVVTINPSIADHTAKVWNITSDQLDGRMLVKTIQLIYGFQLDKHGGHVSLPPEKMQSL